MGNKVLYCNFIGQSSAYIKPRYYITYFPIHASHPLSCAFSNGLMQRLYILKLLSMQKDYLCDMCLETRVCHLDYESGKRYYGISVDPINHFEQE